MPEPSRPPRQALFTAAGAAVLLAVALALPRFQNPYQLLTFTRFLLLAAMAQGWNFIGLLFGGLWWRRFFMDYFFYDRCVLPRWRSIG